MSCATSAIVPLGVEGLSSCWRESSCVLKGYLVHDQATFCGTVRCSWCGQSKTWHTLSASSYAPRSPSASTTFRFP